MQTCDWKCDNQRVTVITPEIDNTFNMRLFRGSGNNNYKTKLDCHKLYEARYEPSGSPAGSVLGLIPGLILGLITNHVASPQLV